MLRLVRQALMADRPRHFSMIREFQLADLVTLLNGFLGAGALLAFMRFPSTSRPPSSGWGRRSCRWRW